MQQFPVRFDNFDPTTMTICCVPSICHVGEPILLANLSETVKVICNNESCMEGDYMHKVCFEQWEYTVLTYLRSTGRARSWSEKQRLQNLWTKKGYDLAYKACSCKCGKGHLRKDLDWIPPAPPLEDQGKKKKHRKKKNDKPTLSVTGNVTVSRHTVSTGQQVPVSNRIRSSSMSSMSSTSGSPPNFAGLESLDSHYGKSAVKVMSGMTVMNTPINGSMYGRERPSNYNIFSRRQDYSSFNTLPRNKINSYHIKTDNEADLYDERDFIFPTLCARKIIGVNCIFCSSQMMIFDRYPLIDGTFFISPQQYSNSSVPLMTIDAGEQYLNAICMACLEGWNSALFCKFCQSRWNGSDLILGTVYSYDVIAAIPCCEMRLKCNNCHIVLPQRRVQFFSDYSRSFLCPNCHVDDYHFVKPLSSFTLKSNSR